ncbi:unnamed protein product [Euphydryas editha]|uniref:Endonuclease-reverse transcriptase n=1 Tax=Euphydryas editha TaxID=104508 RepID=A0AAU9U0R7_EUPED|nr:unnamed protein product [Euphydryas editha]
MKEIEINITNNINKNINEHFKIIEHKYDQLNEQIQNQYKILDRMERHNRKKNLVFFGIEEGEKSYQELENKILKFLNEVNIPCERNEIEALKRLGRNKVKPRPITTIGKKIILLQNQKNNKNRSVYYKEDYPYKVLEKRKQLKIELQKYKAEGKKAIIKYDKSIVLNDYNTNKYQKNQQQSKKRNLQFSPNQSETSHEKQALKRNKITSFMRQRKD